METSIDRAFKRGYLAGAEAMRERAIETAEIQANLSRGNDYDNGWVRSAKMIAQYLSVLPLEAKKGTK